MKTDVTVGLDRTLCIRDMEKVLVRREELEKEDEESLTVPTMTIEDDRASRGGAPRSQLRARVNPDVKSATSLYDEKYNEQEQPDTRGKAVQRKTKRHTQMPTHFGDFDVVSPN